MIRTRKQFWESYQVVIFDCDDTLTMSFKVRSKALLQVAKDLSIPLTVEQIRQAWGKPFNEFVSILYPNVVFDTFMLRYEIAREQYKAMAAAGVPKLLTY